MASTRFVGGLIRAAIDTGLVVFSGYDMLFARSGRRERVKATLGGRPAVDLKPTEAMKIREERDRLRAEGEALDRNISRFLAEQQRDGPLNPAKETIFLIVTSGQAVRGFLVTDVLDRLVARFNVVVITQYAHDPAFLRAYQRQDVHVLPWLTRFKSRFTNVFQYYLIQTSGSPTHKGWLTNLEQRATGRVEGSRRRTRFRHHVRALRISTLLGRLLGAKGLIGLYNSYLTSFLPPDMLRNLFDTYRPALVISTTAHQAAAWPLTHFARQRRVKTLAYVLSWDNCTTKATLDPFAEHCAVWSEEMAQEVERYFPYLASKIVIAGAPIFDMYYQDRLLQAREAFLRGLGLKPEHPVLFYGTNTPAAMPDEPELIATFWEAFSKTRLGGRVSLLVRLHPADKLERYCALQGLTDVAVTVANPDADQEEDGLDAWIPDEASMALLLNSVRHAAVSINVASTMSLESFAAEIPTINVAFRAIPEAREKFLWSFEMYHTSEHYRALVENGAVGIARSLDDLVGQTVEALEYGNLRADAMQRTLAQKVAYRNGASSERFADVVQAIAATTNRVTPAAGMLDSLPCAAPAATSRGT